MIDRHLRLIDSKLRVGYFLVRIQEMRKRIAEQAKIGPPVVSELSGNGPMGLILDPPQVENLPYIQHGDTEGKDEG